MPLEKDRDFCRLFSTWYTSTPTCVCVRACLNSIRPCGTGRNGTRLFMSIRSVPRKKILFVSIQNLGPRQPNHYQRCPFRMPRHNSVFVRNTCPPPSTVMSIAIKPDFICARSVRPFGLPTEEKGAQHMFFLLLYRKMFFSGCMESVRCR